MFIQAGIISLMFESACTNEDQIDPPLSEPTSRETPEVDITERSVWSAEEPKEMAKISVARLLATSRYGQLAFGYRDAWRIEEGELRSLDSPPLLMAWSYEGDQLGIVSQEYNGYQLRVHDAKTHQEIARHDFSLPKPNTRGTYPDPTPMHLVHAPKEGGWAVLGTLGRFIISPRGATEAKHTLQFKDISGDEYLDERSGKLITDSIRLQSPCQNKVSDAAWHSEWKRLAVRCTSHGKSTLHLIDMSSGTVKRSLDLGVGISAVGLVDSETVVALERGGLLRWHTDGVERLPTDPKAESGCLAKLAASSVLEPLSASSMDNGSVWVIGPSVGGRWSNAPWKIAKVDTATCDVTAEEGLGQLTLNNSPLWLPNQRAFVAEISQNERYGPALLSVDDPSEWRYILEENSDPNDYSLSSDGQYLAIGGYEWVKVFSITTNDLSLVTTLPSGDEILACPDTISRLLYKQNKWIVHSPSGEALAVIDSTNERIGCPIRQNP